MSRTCRPSARHGITGKTETPYWAPVFKGFDFSKKWIADLKPDVIILVYNDHASAFSLGDHSDIRARAAPRSSNRRTKAGDRGRCRWSRAIRCWPRHIAQSVILDEFDLTIVNKMDVDHGLTVPLTLMFGQPQEWPCKIIPLP